MKRVLPALVLLGLAAPLVSAAASGALARSAPPSAQEGGLVAYRAATIYQSEQAHHNATLLVRDGKVEALLKQGEALPPLVPVVDFGSAVLMPGLVAADAPMTGSGNQGDRSMGADRRAFDDYDPYADMDTVLERGVTTYYLSPDRRRLVGGRGAVVKSAGTQRVLREVSDLRVSLEPSAYNPPAYFRPPIPPTSENPIRPAQVQAPQSRAGALMALRESITAARWGSGDAHTKALAEFLAERAPLRVAARSHGEIQGALELARAMGASLLVDGGEEVAELAHELAAAKASLIFHPPLFTSLPSFGSDWQPPAADSLRKLRDAGVAVALAPGAEGRWTWLLESAAASMAYGLKEGEALVGVTEAAAAALGVADRVGSLGPGRDADFLVLDGAPLDPATSVREVFINGVRVWQRDRDGRGAAVVLRAGTVWTGQGQPITGGAEVLLKDGKVVAAGKSVPHPAGARLVDAGPHAHITPGFIDARSTYGLGRTVDAEAILGLIGSGSVQNPGWRQQARNGVTTVVVAPASVSKTGTLGAAVKTAAQGSAGAYVDGREIVLIDMRTNDLLDLDKRFDDVLKKGKKYFDTWEKYRADRAKWEEEQRGKQADARAEREAALRERLAKGAAPEPEKAEVAEEEAEESTEEAPVEAEADPLNGLWEGTIVHEMLPEPVSLTARLVHEGSKLTGIFSSPMAPGEEAELEGTWNASTKTAHFEIPTEVGTATISGKVDAPDHMAVHAELAGIGSVDFEMSRTEADAGGVVVQVQRKKKEKGPQEPRKDARQEGMRALFEGRATALVYANQAEVIRAAVGAFEAHKLPMTLVASNDALEVADLLRDKGIGVVAPTSLVVREDGVDFAPAARLHEAGLTTAFQSGGGGGAAMLPRALAMATRYGLGAEQALQAMTSGAAQLLGLQDRVGSLRPGLDGDAVILDGPPFDLRTRVLHVFVNGHEVPQE